MKEKDRNIEKILETIERVRKYSGSVGIDIATEMENALDLGEEQDWFTFSREEIRDWREKLKAKKEEGWKVIDSGEESEKKGEWLLRDRREVEGMMIEFKKRMKVKKEETLGTKGELDKIEKVGMGDNQEVEILREIRIQIEKETLIEEEGELREEIENEVEEPEDVLEDAGVTSRTVENQEEKEIEVSKELEVEEPEDSVEGAGVSEEMGKDKNGPKEETRKRIEDTAYTKSI